MFLVKNKGINKVVWHIADEINKPALCGETGEDGLWSHVKAVADSSKPLELHKICKRCAKLDGRI